MNKILFFFLIIISVSCEKTAEKRPIWIGYINPEMALYSNDFFTCSDTILLNYTSRASRYEKRAGYYGGNKVIKSLLLKQYNPDKYNDSGYLTFRFILNCKGEVGRFVIEEADLNFEDYSFDEGLKKELLEFTRNLDSWRPLCFREENKDVYMYLTYKIKDGKVIEILP
jgi:hypothetical protein